MLRDFGELAVAEHLVLTGDALTDSNNAEQPERVLPRTLTGARVEQGLLRAELPPRSWNVLRLAGKT